MTEPLKAKITEVVESLLTLDSWDPTPEEAADHILKLVAEHAEQPTFEMRHVYALNKARNAVLKEVRRFSAARGKYSDVGAIRSADSMTESWSASAEVASHLRKVIDAVRARAEREAKQ